MSSGWHTNDAVFVVVVAVVSYNNARVSPRFKRSPPPPPHPNRIGSTGSVLVSLESGTRPHLERRGVFVAAAAAASRAAIAGGGWNWTALDSSQSPTVDCARQSVPNDCLALPRDGELSVFARF